MGKNTAKKISITLTPELASYVKDMANLLKAPISKVIAFALISQKNKGALIKRKEKLLKAYKQIAGNYNASDLASFEKLQWELSNKLD